MVALPSKHNMTVKTPSFTIAQIKEAHSKVRSGADFPKYIKAIKKLGVTHYNSYVADGHIDYFDGNNQQVTVPAKYDKLPIAGESNIEAFKTDLKAHQQGKTDFPTFCKDCAKSGDRVPVDHSIAGSSLYSSHNSPSVLPVISTQTASE